MSNALLIYAARITLIPALIFLIVSIVVTWFWGPTWITMGLSTLGAILSVLSLVLLIMSRSYDW